MEGTALGLDIRRRADRLVPSEGGESAQSIAVTGLSQKSFEFIPIAQKIADKQFRYVDGSGGELTKEKAMDMAGGVIYYQEASDPSKGRLRHRGAFVSEERARSIAAHSIAVIALSQKNLEGIPIAQKMADKQFRYLDGSGGELTKQKAMELAGGVIYYQETSDPSTGRLRRRGAFVSEDRARSIVSGSRGGSDVADLRDFEEHDANLHSIDEDPKETQALASKTTRDFRKLLRSIAVIICVIGSVVAFMCFMSLDPLPSQRLARWERISYGLDGTACGTDFERHGVANHTLLLPCDAFLGGTVPMSFLK